MLFAHVIGNISFSRVLTTQLPGKDIYHAIYTAIQLMTCCMGKTTFHCMRMKYSPYKFKTSLSNRKDLLRYLASSI